MLRGWHHFDHLTYRLTPSSSSSSCSSRSHINPFTCGCPVSHRTARVTARFSSLIGGEQHCPPPLPSSNPPILSSHPLLSSSPLLSSPLVLGRVYYRWDSRINSCVCAHRVLRGEWKRRRCRSRKKQATPKGSGAVAVFTVYAGENTQTPSHPGRQWMRCRRGGGGRGRSVDAGI